MPKLPNYAEKVNLTRGDTLAVRYSCGHEVRIGEFKEGRKKYLIPTRDRCEQCRRERKVDNISNASNIDDAE